MSLDTIYDHICIHSERISKNPVAILDTDIHDVKIVTHAHMTGISEIIHKFGDRNVA